MKTKYQIRMRTKLTSHSSPLPATFWMTAFHIFPSSTILLYYSKDLCLHLITACYWMWYQSMMFLYSEFHVNKCDTTHNRQQQTWHGTQAVERFSSVRLLLFFPQFFHDLNFIISEWKMSSKFFERYKNYYLTVWERRVMKLASRQKGKPPNWNLL